MGSVAEYSASVSLIKKDRTPGKQLASVASDIYYYENSHDDDDDVDGYLDGDEESEEGSNEMESDFIVTQEFIDSLRPGDIIRLYGDGSCY